VPMLPVVAGERATRIQIGLYTLPMMACAVAPWAMGLTGPLYGIVASVASAIFGALALVVFRRSNDKAMKQEKRLFFFSILYLFLLFGALALDRMLGL
jgi:heme o synthase